MTPKTCEGYFRALKECRRKHHRQPVVCERLEAASGWCAISLVCPQEVEDLEACAGKRSSVAFQHSGPPPNIPRSCHEQVLRLEVCLTEQQAKLEQQHDQG